MKKLLLITSLIFSLFVTSFAQQSQQTKTPQQQAEHHAKKLTKELSLNANQTSQIEPVFLQQFRQIDAIKSKYASSTDKKAEHSETKAVHAQTDASLKQILTPDQYNQYETIKAQKKAQHKSAK